MQTRLKNLLIVLAVLISQSFAISLAATHEADPAHTGDECAICLSIQAQDDGPLPSLDGPDMLPVLYWSVGDVASVDAVLKARDGSAKARAPPA